MIWVGGMEVNFPHCKYQNKQTKKKAYLKSVKHAREDFYIAMMLKAVWFFHFIYPNNVYKTLRAHFCLKIIVVLFMTIGR